MALNILLLLALAACTPATQVTLTTPTATVPPTITPTVTGTIQWFPSTRTPTPQPTLPVIPTADQRPGVGALLWQDEFNSRSQWSGMSGVTSGEGEITLANPGNGPGMLLSLRSNTSQDNFYLEITSDLSLCRGSDNYGLLLRALSAQDFYRFVVACSGQLRLERVKNGQVALLQDWVFSGQVPPGAPLVLKLGVWAAGGQLHFFVNDRFQFAASDPVFTYGSIGVFARTTGQSPLTVSFSDLKVYQIDAGAIPAPTRLSPPTQPAPPATATRPAPRQSATPVFQRPSITPTPTRKPTITPVFRPTETP